MRVFAYFLREQKVGRPGGETPKAKEFAGTRRQKERGNRGSAPSPRLTPRHPVG